MARRLLLPASVVAAVVLAAFACVSPDEVRVAVFGGKTNYPSETSQFDSNTVGGEVSVGFDVGRRAQAHDAEIKLLEEMTRERAAARAKEAPPTEKKTNPAERNTQLLVALTGLVTALGGLGIWKREKIMKGVRHCQEHLTKKKGGENKPCSKT